MASKDLYTIKLLNWEKHNPGAKKYYKKSLIQHDFCDDGKLGTLPLSHRWMFLALILICGDKARDTVELNERQLREYLESSKSIESALSSLQEIQLLTYKKTSLNEIKENKDNNNKKGSNPENKTQGITSLENQDLVVVDFLKSKRHFKSLLKYSNEICERFQTLDEFKSFISTCENSFYKNHGSNDISKTLSYVTRAVLNQIGKS